ncbi:MAG TPA: NAD(P)/FAD-dependent oxidoreductase [Ktedonobacteraceae bacterium]|nr:NAD(P)/FAD-dependent oxidoreductase [Ktedonobacteraceae bacterium]
MSERFDAIVIGTGPGGESAIERLQRGGMRLAVIERELIGGECAYWACIPSKTLLRVTAVRSEARHVAGVAMPDFDWAQVADYRDSMVRYHNDSKQAEAYAKQGITFIRGEARLLGPGHVEVAGRDLEAPRIVVATGSQPRIPPIEGLQEAGYWTNRQATSFSQIPESVIVLGGSAQAIELAQMLRRFGAEVTLIERGHHLMSREEPNVGIAIAEYLSADGMVLRLNSEAVHVTKERDGTRVVHLKDGSQARGQQILVALGRVPQTEKLGLEKVGATITKHGVKVDEYCRAAPGVWAVGDVTGIGEFTHVAEYQGRIAADDILGRGHPANYSAIPRVVFSDPEIAATGMTSQQAREQGIDVVLADLDLAQTLSRPSTYGKNIDGHMGLIADRKRGVLVGAWAIGPEAGEWIHQAVQAIRAAIPISVLRDVIIQFPTFSEAYLYALEKLDA